MGSDKLLVIYTTPEEESRVLLFYGWVYGRDPADYSTQLEGFMPDKSCALPYVTLAFQGDDDIPAVICSKMGYVEARVIELV